MANTKIPWELSAYEHISHGGLQEITDAEGEVVGDIVCFDNANFIVHAVNNLDALVEVLEKIRDTEATDALAKVKEAK